MGNTIRQIDEKDILIFLQRIQHHFSNHIRDPVVLEIVLRYWAVGLDDGDHLLGDFLLQCGVHTVWLLVAQDVHADVAEVELLEELAAVFDRSEGLVCADVS